MEIEYSRTPGSEKASKTPILIMTVDIGEGLKDNIIIYEDSSIEEVVQLFSEKHNLSKDQETTLLTQIQNNLYDENTEPQEMSRNEYFTYWNQEIDKRLIKAPEYQPSINKKSMQLIQHRQAVPVYERLYSLSTKNKPVPEEIQEKPKGKQCGERLYNNWICRKQKSDYTRSKAIEEKEEEISKTLTFKPKINNYFPVPPSHRHDSQNFKKHKEENLERKRFELLAKEQEVCTFVPQINPASECILQNKFRLKTKNKFEELYEEASIRKEKNEELAHQ